MLRDHDPEIARLLKEEREKQRDTLNLIPSENFVCREVLTAVGSILTNKYAEGYPGRRYYGGCQFIDEVERIARDRACALFGCEHANVQPHSGSQANMAAYFSVLSPGDTILTMQLSSGGHLTHGAPVNFSGLLYHVATYGVNRDTELLDYDEIREIALREKPRMIVCGASSYSRILDFEQFSRIAREVGAFLLTDIAHIAGLVVAGLHPSPVPHAEFVSSTTHKNLRGPRGGLILCREEFRGRIDSAIFPGMQGGPLVHVIAGKAIAFRDAMTPAFARYQEKILRNASRLCSEMKNRGYRIVSGGTDNHLMVIDLRDRKMTGLEAQEILERVGIIVNKNSIPYEALPASVTSGIRIGTPAVTTRGLDEKDMALIAEWIDAALTSKDNATTLREIAARVRRFIHGFPLHP